MKFVMFLIYIHVQLKLPRVSTDNFASPWYPNTLSAAEKEVRFTIIHFKFV